MILRLLLIEDNENDALLIVRELQRGGYKVTWQRVETAPTLRATLVQPWDVITCDWAMPQFSAPEALSVLREHPVDAPIIIVSGEVGEEVAVSAMRAGAHDFVSKEKLARLVPVVERELRDAEARRARTRAEDALKDSEQHFRLLIEKALDLVAIVDADGTTRYASPSHLDVTGYTPAELIGRNGFEFIHPDDVQNVVRRFTGGLTREDPRGSTEYRFRRKDGSWCVIEAVARDLLTDPLVRGVLVTSRDITKRRRAEDAARERTRVLDAVFDHSLSCLVLLDRHFNFIRVNAAYARACRREIHEFAGRNHFDLYPSDARPIFEQVVQTKQPFEVIARPFSFPNQPERGVTYWDWTLVPLLDERGEVEFLLFSLHDVTEHVRTAEALRTGEERFRALIERSLDLIAIIDRDGTYRYVNPAHEVASGFRPDELVGMSTFDLLHPDDVRDLAPKLAAAIRTGEKTATVEYRLRHKDGSWRFFEGVALNLTDDAEVAGLLVTGRDVTERKWNEERLRAHALRLDTLHEIYRAILDARSVSEVVGAAVQRIRNLIPCELAIVLLFDTEAGVARVVACEPPDTLGPGEITLPLADFSAASTFVEHPVICIDDIATLTPASSIVQRLCSAGMHSLLTEALISEGQLLGVLTLSAARPAAFDGLQQDIAREVADQLAIALYQARLHERLRQHAADLEERVQERTAQIEAANRELATFSYSVSHDLRAPLRAIDGFGRLLLDEYGATLDAEARHYLDRIVAGTERMGHLIEDLLRLSRVAQQEMVRQRVNLSELARAIAADLRKNEPHRPVEIVITPELVATGDAPLLRIALENLLGNAWKYTSKHPTARIEFGTTERDGRLVYFVRDDGAGFDMVYADKLFGAFQRLHGQSEFEGTGIGLATVQRIIHRHGGRIWAEGAVDKGATFYFTLRSQ